MADAPAAPAPKKTQSPFTMLLVMLLVFYVMINNDLRLFTGRVVGYALNPVTSLWGFDLVWTLVFASIVMILGTTILRHYLIDWMALARAQEGMRKFQKEFSEARKSNNTYKLKRLTDAQPKIMEMQGEMSQSQLRPMLWTMLIVIPLFAWLSVFPAEPVDFEVEGAGEPALLVSEMHGGSQPDVEDARLVGGRTAVVAHPNRLDMYVMGLPNAAGTPGALTVEHPERGVVATMNGNVDVDWTKVRVGELAAGDWRVYPARGPGEPKVAFTIGKDDARDTLSHVLVLAPATGTAEPVPLLVDGNGRDVSLPFDAVVYAIVPLPKSTNPTGGLKDVVCATADVRENVCPTGTAKATWDVTFETNGVLLGASHATVTPHSVRLPWNADSDLNGTTVLPHWILLYSLFSIPVGTVTQRALKLVEYRRADLGHAPGAGAG